MESLIRLCLSGRCCRKGDQTDVRDNHGVTDVAMMRGKALRAGGDGHFVDDGRIDWVLFISGIAKITPGLFRSWVNGRTTIDGEEITEWILIRRIWLRSRIGFVLVIEIPIAMGVIGHGRAKGDRVFASRDLAFDIPFRFVGWGRFRVPLGGWVVPACCLRDV